MVMYERIFATYKMHSLLTKHDIIQQYRDVFRGLGYWAGKTLQLRPMFSQYNRYRD